MYIMKGKDDLFYLRIHEDASTVYEASAESDSSWMGKVWVNNSSLSLCEIAFVYLSWPFSISKDD